MYQFIRTFLEYEQFLVMLFMADFLENFRLTFYTSAQKPRRS
jgi:hypothetical protein